MSETNYYDGQGKLYIAEVTNGVTGSFTWLGDVSGLTISTEVEKKEKKENWSGTRATAKVIYTGKTVTYSYTLDELTLDNIAKAFQGTIDSVAAGSVTDEEAPASLQKGDMFALAHQAVSAVVVKDSSSTPKTLVEGTDYMVNAKYGSVEFMSDKTTLTMPLKVSYSYGEAKKCKLLQAGAKEYAYRFEGLNTAEGNQPVLVEIFKSSLDPAKQFGFITDDFASLEVEGEALSTAKGLVDVTML